MIWFLGIYFRFFNTSSCHIELSAIFVCNLNSKLTWLTT